MVTRAEALAIRREVKKAQQALAAAMAKARKARWMVARSQTGMSTQRRPKKRKTRKQRRTSCLVTASAAEQSRATGPRAANARVRVCHALIQAASSLWVTYYQRTVISVPIRAPHRPTTTYHYAMPDSTDHQIKASFAMCVMHRILFGHAQFALPRFTAAMKIIGGDHDVMSITRAIRLFREAEANVLEKLASIQALAMEQLPQSTLTGVALARAAKKSGLVALSALRRKKVAVYKRKFARTPDELSADLHDIIELARPEFEREWERSPMSSGGYMPPCGGRCRQAGCTQPIVSEETIRAVLIDGMWSQPGA